MSKLQLASIQSQLHDVLTYTSLKFGSNCHCACTGLGFQRIPISKRYKTAQYCSQQELHSSSFILAFAAKELFPKNLTLFPLPLRPDMVTGIEVPVVIATGRLIAAIANSSKNLKKAEDILADRQLTQDIQYLYTAAPAHASEADHLRKRSVWKTLLLRETDFA